MGFLIPLAFIAGVGLLVRYGVRRVKQISSMWQAAARDLGLDYKRHRIGMPAMSGKMRGLRVAVDIYRQGSGKNSQTFTRYVVAYPSPGFDFRLSRQTGLSRIGKLFGAQDVAVGDRSFDESFVVKTDDARGLRAWLGPSRLSMLVRNAAAYPGLVVTDTAVRIQTSGLETSRERLISTLRRVVDTAHALSDRRAPKSSIVGRRANSPRSRPSSGTSQRRPNRSTRPSSMSTRLRRRAIEMRLPNGSRSSKGTSPTIQR